MPLKHFSHVDLALLGVIGREDTAVNEGRKAAILTLSSRFWLRVGFLVWITQLYKTWIFKL